jgi:metal-responsive CopG/Arc/MetJ family transcriptional regulator
MGRKGGKAGVGKPVVVRLEDELLDEVEKFRVAMGYSYTTEAFRKLLKLGLEKATR